jgi:hypothetical protein
MLVPLHPVWNGIAIKLIVVLSAKLTICTWSSELQFPPDAHSGDRLLNDPCRHT